jgi:hypothetical protein
MRATVAQLVGQNLIYSSACSTYGAKGEPAKSDDGKQKKRDDPLSERGHENSPTAAT